MNAFDQDLNEWLKDPDFAREYERLKGKLDVSKNPSVTVKIELHLINGVHFNPSMRELSKEELIEEATQAYIGWLDSWCGEKDKNSLKEYIQAKIST